MIPDKDKLIPKIKLEYQLLNYVAEKLTNGGEVDNVGDILYHKGSSDLFERIATGEDCTNDLSLSDDFLDAFTSETQAKQIKSTLSDLKGRRKHLAETTRDVFDFEKNNYATQNKVIHWDEMLNGSIDRTLNNPRGFLPDQWPHFWNAIRGFMPGEIVGIAGGSGSGKTTFAIELLTQLQNKYDCKTAFISCEMSQDALADKIIRRKNDISQMEYSHKVKTNVDSIKKEDYGNWSKCVFHYSIYNLKDIKDFIKKEKPKFFCLDYMQMILREPGFSSGDWSLYFMNSIKELCKEVGTICFAIMQLDKEAQKKDHKGNKKVPSLTDIFGGTGYKQALDTGIVLYGDEDKRFVYIDKARDQYEGKYMWKHFEVIGNPETGRLNDLRPKFRLD